MGPPHGRLGDWPKHGGGVTTEGSEGRVKRLKVQPAIVLRERWRGGLQLRIEYAIRGGDDSDIACCRLPAECLCRKLQTKLKGLAEADIGMRPSKRQCDYVSK
jgi:hypothetical protein